MSAIDFSMAEDKKNLMPAVNAGIRKAFIMTSSRAVRSRSDESEYFMRDTGEETWVLTNKSTKNCLKKSFA